MNKFIDIFYDKFIAFFVVIFGVIMTLTILLQIFSRSFMSTPFSWTEELSRFTFIWFCFLGSGVAMKHKAHLGIDYFYTKMNEKEKFYVSLFIDFCVCLFSIYLIDYGIKICIMMNKQVSSALGIRMSFVYAVLPITGFLFLLVTLYFFIESIQNKKSSQGR